MRLKKLILQGFKSFADRTEFVFDSPVTGIVGPNGCGKSNVVDGFKWVLGEQSAKSLRGEAMLDVIFNGSAARKPAGMAEVVLVFDNPKNQDGARTLNLDLDEVAVGRRLYRDGTSEYQVNNANSRLKDVRELFLDTGVGVDAYSVIEQGRVSLLLESNPQERRLIFEEAAGISKFKARKKEAQRKLERVDQNLLRVNDIVEEVEKRLRSVKIQAGRARVFREYSERLAEVRLTHSLHEYHVHNAQLLELTGQAEDARFRLDDASADLARRQNELAGRRERLEAQSNQRQQVEYELVQARAAVQSALQRQQYAQQQLVQMAEQLDAFSRDREALAAKISAVEESLAGETELLQRLTTELETHRAQIEQRQQSFRDGQLRLNEVGKQVEQHKAAVLDFMRKLAQVGSRIGAIQIERRNLTAQQERIEQRRQTVQAEIEALETQRAAFVAKLEEAAASLAAHQARQEGLSHEAARLGRDMALLGEQLGAAREHRSGLLSRQRLLADMESKREGVSEGVKSVLKQREQAFSFVRGLVADVLRVDVEHARVVEAALDGRDQFLIADDSTAARAALQAADLEGRVNVVCTDELARTNADEAYDWNRHPHRIRLAADLVRFEPQDAPVAHHLLGRTIVVDDLPAAGALQEQGPAGYRHVTSAGEVLEADGTLRAGPLTAAMGLLSRRSELEAIAQQVAEVDARVAQLSGHLAEGSAAAKAVDEQQKLLREEISIANALKVETTSRLAQNADKQAALQRELPLLERELKNFLEQAARLANEEAELTRQREAMEADQAQRQQQIEELTTGQQQLAEEMRHMGEELTALRVQFGQVQEKQLAAQQHVQRQKAALTELGQQAERIARSAESVSARRGDLEAELQAAQGAQAAMAEKQQELAGRIESLTAAVAEAGREVQAMMGQVESLRAEHADIERSLHAVDLRLGEVRVRLESLVQRTRDELQLELPARYESLAADGGPGYQPGETDWDAVAEEIRQLREKIQRLGNVNLDSIGEQEELEKREQFLTAQVQDLTTSKLQLEDLINTINAESGVRFEQTFNAVREHFQGMFRKLFGGGKADIYLETELEEKPGAGTEAGADGEPVTTMRKIDILDAGIEIIARPPGKQPVSISQLSGGEKTMTCVALLMSIFKSKPSPFCILDEVDAALDEANNQRFNLIVQEFLEQSQFIVITHSKRTMQIADVLYGVTMQEQGVSKRVAVKFDQVDGQGRISEQAA